jgi:predicted nucleic acid-binding protein
LLGNQTRRTIVRKEVRAIIVTIDTSALLAVLLNESSRSALIAATEGASLVGAPSLPWEVGNALVAGVLRGRLAASVVEPTWRGFVQVPVRLAQIDIAEALELAVSLRVYAYDAYVLETARTERAPLLTLDAALARAARAIGVSIVELRK